MAVFEVEIGGKIYEVDAPDQASAIAAAGQFKPAAHADKYKAAALATMEDRRKTLGPEYDGAADLGRQFLQGISMGGADEALAALRTPIEMFRQGTFNPVEGYNYAKARENLELEEGRKRNGLMGTAMEVIGGAGAGMGIASAVQKAAPAATAAGRAAQRVFGGAGAEGGAIARAGSNAASGAGYGAVAGALDGEGEGRLASAIKGGALGGAIGGGLTIAGQAASPLMGWASATANPAGFAERQIARMTADSGRGMSEITRDLTEAGAAGLPYTLADAMGNAGQRGLSVVARNPGQGRQQVVEFLENRQAGQSDRLSSALADNLRSPATAANTKATLEAERRAAGNANYGAAEEAAGAVDPSGAIRMADSFLTPGVNKIASPQSGIADDSIEAAVRKARSYLTDGKSTVADYNTALRAKWEIDAMIERAAPTVKRQLIPIRNELDDALASASKPYASARNQYREQSKAIDAVDTGTNWARSGRMDDIVPAYKGMSEAEQGGVRAGYADSLIGRIQSSAPGVDKSRLLSSDKQQNVLAELAGIENSKAMADTIRRERAMFDTRANAMGGSKTADNLSDNAAIGVDPEIIGNLLTGKFGQAAKNIVSRSADNLGGNTAAVRERMAELLLSRDGGKAENVLVAAMKKYRARQNKKDAAMRGVLGGYAGSEGQRRMK